MSIFLKCFLALVTIFTFDLSKYGCRHPIILSIPTWVTVGPANFWNGGKNALQHEDCNWGVFTTGLRAEIALTFIPARLGHWYFDVEGRYYCLINKNLLQAQIDTLGLKSIHQAHRNVGVISAGFGVSF
jgi:hypothetical protein